MAPCAHRFAVSAFALAGCLGLPVGAATWQGDQSIIAEWGELGNLSVDGWIDYGTASSNTSFPGVKLQYLGGPENSATVELHDPLSSVLWQDNVLSGTPRAKMKLGTDNILSLYNSAGSAATISLQGGTGQIHLTGTGSGIYSGGTSVFTVGATGGITWDRPISMTNTTASTSSTTGALVVAGGLGVAKDSYINGLRVGRGNGNLNTNVALGFESLLANSGDSNTGVGAYTLRANTSGYNNSSVGSRALYSNTTGINNTAMGASSLYSNTTGRYNTAVGRISMNANTTGQYNVGIGDSALTSLTSANFNTAVGYGSLQLNNGVGNSAVGQTAMLTNMTGTYNTAMGMASLYSNTSGSLNVGIGFYAGRFLADGYTALTDPENSIYIGSYSRGLSNADANSIVIGYEAIGEGANTTVIGSSATTSTHLYGQTKANSLKVSGKTDLNDQVVVEAPVAPQTPVRAMRVLADGTILIKPGSDLSMGGFTAGAQP